MDYRIVFSKRAMRDISRLEPEIKEKIGHTLGRYGKDPLNYARKMIDPSLGSYRFRVGDYRVIFDIEGDEIVVLRVDHRKEIYRR